MRAWNVAVSQAVTVAQQAGKLPAGLRRVLDDAAEAQVGWRELLGRLWSETTLSDFSWMRPNRRHIWTGLYLPGILREGAGEVTVAVDCSGSVNNRQLRLFEAEVRSILEGQRPERVYVLYFDADVQKVETFEPGQPVSLNPVGGGGTEFGPCFEWLEEHGIAPQTLVFLTDLIWFVSRTRAGLPRSLGVYKVQENTLRSGHSHASSLTECHLKEAASLPAMPACSIRAKAIPTSPAYLTTELEQIVLRRICWEELTTQWCVSERKKV